MATSDYTLFESKNLHFSLEHPSEWQATELPPETGTAAVLFAAVPPWELNLATPNLTITLQPMPGMTLKQFASVMMQNLHGAEDVRLSDSTLAGMECKLIQFEFEPPGAPSRLTAIQAWAVEEGVGYLCNFFCPIGESSRWVPKARHMLKTLRVGQDAGKSEALGKATEAMMRHMYEQEVAKANGTAPNAPSGGGSGGGGGGGGSQGDARSAAQAQRSVEQATTVGRGDSSPSNLFLNHYVDPHTSFRAAVPTTWKITTDSNSHTSSTTSSASSASTPDDNLVLTGLILRAEFIDPSETTHFQFQVVRDTIDPNDGESVDRAIQAHLESRGAFAGDFQRVNIPGATGKTGTLVRYARPLDDEAASTASPSSALRVSTSGAKQAPRRDVYHLWTRRDNMLYHAVVRANDKKGRSYERLAVTLCTSVHFNVDTRGGPPGGLPSVPMRRAPGKTHLYVNLAHNFSLLLDTGLYLVKQNEVPGVLLSLCDRRDLDNGDFAASVQIVTNAVPPEMKADLTLDAYTQQRLMMLNQTMAQLEVESTTKVELSGAPFTMLSATGKMMAKLFVVREWHGIVESDYLFQATYASLHSRFAECFDAARQTVQSFTRVPLYRASAL